MEGTEITAHISSNGAIFAVTGYLTPATAELATATTPDRLNLSLGQAAARSAVEADLKIAGIDPERVMQMGLEKIVTADSPYVVWKADVILKNGEGRWLYRVDAFTGVIITKRSNIQTSQGPSTPRTAPGVAPANQLQPNTAAPAAAKKAPSVGTKLRVPGAGPGQKPEAKLEHVRTLAPKMGTKVELPGIGLEKKEVKPTPARQAAPRTGTKAEAPGIGRVQTPAPKLQSAQYIAPLTGTKDELPTSDRPQTPQQAPKQ